MTTLDRGTRGIGVTASSGELCRDDLAVMWPPNKRVYVPKANNMCGKDCVETVNVYVGRFFNKDSELSSRKTVRTSVK